MALAVPITARTAPWSAFALTLVGTAASAGASLWALLHVIDDGLVSYHLGSWAPPVGIEYVVDNIAAFVALVVTSISLLVLISTRRFADREMRDRIGPFYGLVLLLLAGLTGMVVTGDLFNLFVFLEISSLAAYALVFMGGRKGMIAGFRYLILGSIGGSFYLLGVGFIYFATGTLNMADIKALLEADSSARSIQAGAIFIFAGLGLKMALVPLHLWLPDAYTHAPSSVNALIAPVMTKVGAYAMLRMFLNVFPDGYLQNVVPVADALLVLGVIGVLFGAVAAASQTDIRRVLAYSSIGQLAMIAVAIGLASPLAFIAALLHIMNHAVMKATLFLSAASVRLSTGSSEVDGFIGLGRRMPVTMASFTVAAIAMVGIPPAAGFFSKWYVVQAAIDTDQWAVVAVVLASSLLSAVYLLRVIERAYLRTPAPVVAGAAPDAPNVPGEGSKLDVLMPIVLLVVATIVLGVFNTTIVTQVLEPSVR